MKFKGLLIISIFLLSIILMGAVSAADDSDLNGLEINQDNEDLIDEEETTETLIDEEEGEESGSISLDVSDGVDVDADYSTIATVYDGDCLNGTVTLVIDDKDTYAKSYSTEYGEYYHFFTIRDLGSIPSFGLHKLNLTYNKYGAETPFSILKMAEFKYTFELTVDGESADKFEVEYGTTSQFEFALPNDSNGVLTFMLNSKKYSLPVKEKYTPVKISFKDFKIGTHILEAQYLDNNNKYPVNTLKVPINVAPRVYYPELMSVGEKDVVSLTAPAGSKITAVLYKGDDLIQVANVSGKGRVEIQMDKIAAKGLTDFLLNYTVDGFSKDVYFECFCYANTNKVKTTLTKTGDSVTITATGPKGDSEFNIVLDDGKYNYVPLSNGKMKHVISKLSIGRHKIKIVYWGEESYSKTYFVTVKESDKVSLTLKKVNVKRSAKKLVLKATLKINKKAKKGLKVTFKFNGKKYVAKTDKKGVAKLTIKKKVLKKLRAGKKVKYMAKYSFKTVKYTVKVKR